ncbi:MAG: hypothetical protein K0S47_466 [Herbinix sp.]|jgi:CubicO group peptidase (beta-lactamase class C family)|nr:hypothetical protein [Herbinix sp.]
MSYINPNEIDKILDDIEFSGSVHIMRNSDILYHKTSGWADYEARHPFTDGTTLELASLSKQFTATAVMTLVEGGKLLLDDTLDNYIPEYEFSNYITIRHLLNHTSGIVDYSGEILVPKAKERREKELGRKLNSSFEVTECINSLCKAYTVNECLELIKGSPLHFKPGDGTAYSNTNYHFLSDIIERITDMSFHEYLITNIFKVLGMHNSHASGLQADAKGYAKDENGTMFDCGRHGMRSGDSGVVSSMKDMICWCSAILNSRLLRQESWNQCFQIINDRYGMGFQKFDHWIGHNGGMPGISTRERLHLPSKTAILVLSNTTIPHHDIINEIMQCIKIDGNTKSINQ